MTGLSPEGPSAEVPDQKARAGGGAEPATDDGTREADPAADGVPAAAPSALEEAVARVGDRWTLLLINALLDGPRRFNELLDQLTGLAPNILSKRLKHLENEGVVVASPYSHRPVRFAYQLTSSGAELAGALRLLAQWGGHRAAETEPLRHMACGTPVEARWYCPTCALVVEGDEADDLDYA